MSIIRFLTLSIITVFSLSAVGAQGEEGRPVVLFDEGHGQLFTIGQKGPLQLSGFAGVLEETGANVRQTRKTVSAESLKGADALIISGPFKPFRDEEIEAIKGFIKNGGRLALFLHVAPPFENLLSRLGLKATGGVVYEKENVIGGTGQDFNVVKFESHPVVHGLDGFSVYGSWGVGPAGGNVKIIAKTGPSAWVDHNRDFMSGSGDPTGEFGIIVAGKLGEGELVVIGDDAIFQNKFLKEGNLMLAKNLAAWLVKRIGAPSP